MSIPIPVGVLRLPRGPNGCERGFNPSSPRAQALMGAAMTPMGAAMTLTGAAMTATGAAMTPADTTTTPMGATTTPVGAATTPAGATTTPVGATTPPAAAVAAAQHARAALRCRYLRGVSAARGRPTRFALRCGVQVQGVFGAADVIGAVALQVDALRTPLGVEAAALLRCGDVLAYSFLLD